MHATTHSHQRGSSSSKTALQEPKQRGCVLQALWQVREHIIVQQCIAGVCYSLMRAWFAGDHQHASMQWCWVVQVAEVVCTLAAHVYDTAYDSTSLACVAKSHIASSLPASALTHIHGTCCPSGHEFNRADAPQVLKRICPAFKGWKQHQKGAGACSKLEGALSRQVGCSAHPSFLAEVLSSHAWLQHC